MCLQKSSFLRGAQKCLETGETKKSLEYKNFLETEKSTKSCEYVKLKTGEKAKSLEYGRVTFSVTDTLQQYIYKYHPVHHHPYPDFINCYELRAFEKVLWML